MSIYLVIVIALAFISVLITVLPQFSACRRQKAEFVSYFLTLSATLVGVFFAIYFADLQKNAYERKRVEQVVLSGEREARDVRKKATLLLATLEYLGSSQAYADRKMKVEDFIALPQFIFATMNDQGFMKQISDQGFSYLKSELHTLKRLYDKIQQNNLRGGKTFKKTIKNIETFCVRLACIEELLKL
ncbi:MAG: hypothetical protein AB1401_09310 [Thermodesulfobacteriota bacterium]